MSATEKREFVFNWKIDLINKSLFGKPIDTSTSKLIESPPFRVEFLEGTEWFIRLILVNENIECVLSRNGDNNFSEPIEFTFQFELSTFDGIVLKNSDVLTKKISKGFCVLTERDLTASVDQSELEGVCLRCRIKNPHITPSVTSSTSLIVNCEAVTNIVNAKYPFEFSLQFSGSEGWETAIKIHVENMPIDIAFKYVGNKLQMDLIPKIESNTYHTVDCAMDLRDEKSKTIYYGFGMFKFNNTRREWRFPKFVQKKYLQEANCFNLRKVNVKMVIGYWYHSKISEIKSIKGDFKTLKETFLTQNKKNSNCMLYLQQHLRNMWNDKIHADVELRADDEVFFAHKCLLATRSPIFKAMFDQDMLESKTNTIDIHDIEAKTLNYFLEYLYTGTVDDMDDNIALSLLVVGDKYQVRPLTEKCSTFLRSVLSLDNVLNVLVVSDMVNEGQLKVSAVDFIVENSKQVLSVKDWTRWVKKNPIIASDVLLKLSETLNSSC